MTTHEPLKIKAKDLDDMDYVASLLQDAIVPMRDVAFLPQQKRFVMVVNRFRWEALSPEQAEALKADPKPENAPQSDHEARDASFQEMEEEAPYSRVHSGLVFEKVLGASHRNLDLGDKSRLLNLLTISTELKSITFYFSDDAMIRLRVSDIRCYLEDVGEAWPTWAAPSH